MNLHHTNAYKKHQRQRQHQIIPYDNFSTIFQSSQLQVINRSIESKKKMNYNRLVKRLKYKLRSANVVIQKN
jgi:hypothetical protein